MKRNATNVIDWIQHWDNFDYGLYLAILKAKHYNHNISPLITIEMEIKDYNEAEDIASKLNDIAKAKEETIKDIGDMLLEILELDNVTFQSWLTQEEDE